MDICKHLCLGGVSAFALVLGLAACGDDSSSKSVADADAIDESKTELADGKVVTCDSEHEGLVAAIVNGDFRRCKNGAWVKISRDEALEADEILGYKGESSSSSVKVVSSSSAKVVSSSSAPAVDLGSSSSDSDVVTELYECPDGQYAVTKEECPSDDAKNSSSSNDAGSSSDVPGADPETPSGKPAWQYLNPDITYGEFTDERDNQVYKTVEICNSENKNCQTWMAENLNYNIEGKSLCGGGEKRTKTEGDCSIYGRLYTWEVAMDEASCGYENDCDNIYEGAQGACPTDWHLPSDADWETLIENVGGAEIAGRRLKASTDLWTSFDGVTNDDSYGFSVLPSGGHDVDGLFDFRGLSASFWSSTEGRDGAASSWEFGFENSVVDKILDNKSSGSPIRCLQDSPNQGGEPTDPSSSESSSSDTPGTSTSTDPESSGGSEGAETDEPAAVMPDGYYSNSENCPAGLTCKYATNTDYLNSTKTYGEILDTRDGLVYKTIKICDDKNETCQTWMAQNLNYNPGDVSSMGSYAWSGCYDNESANCSKYGRLYTWEVAMDKAECGYGTYCNNSYEGTQGVCPAGWHLPSNAEWSALYDNIGGTSNAGSLLKSTSGWNYGGNGTDKYGFSVLAAGYRYDRGYFTSNGNNAYFWSSSENDRSIAWRQHFDYRAGYVDQYDSYEDVAFSVRCLKD